METEALYIIGIDPGKSGAFAILQSNGEFVAWHPMPIELNWQSQLAGKLAYWNAPAVVFLERAQAFPGQGGSSIFNFGSSYGGILAILDILGMSYRIISPGKWVPAMHAAAGVTPCFEASAKQKSFLAVSQLFPDESFILPGRRVPHDGAIDATLIAEFGRRLLFGDSRIVVGAPA